MRYMGIDFGTKRVGLALSDEAGRMGFPYATYPNDGRLLDAVRELMIQKQVKTVVVGDSRNASNEPNPVMTKAKEFARMLESLADADVEWEPERYTTQEARRDPEGVRTGSNITVDASAAALILTSYLSRINGPSEEVGDLVEDDSI
jgi:putative Holliday junction resolvase